MGTVREKENTQGKEISPQMVQGVSPLLKASDPQTSSVCITGTSWGLVRPVSSQIPLQPLSIRNPRRCAQ